MYLVQIACIMDDEVVALVVEKRKAIALANATALLIRQDKLGTPSSPVHVEVRRFSPLNRSGIRKLLDTTVHAIGFDDSDWPNEPPTSTPAVKRVIKIKAKQ